MLGMERATLPAEEAELLRALRGNDPGAYERLVRQHLARMLAVARRILGNEADAQEAVQDAFLSAFKGLAGFDGASRLSTWLHRVAVNAALMKRRSRQRRPERPIDDLLPRFLEDGHQADPPAPWQDSAEELLGRQETRELVRRLIDELPDSYRTVLLLRDIEGLDTEETARLLGVTTSVVKTRLHRARQALRTLLDPHVRGGPA
jgi:RNA polymerase sigma-70 factor (ECF subfamily)